MKVIIRQCMGAAMAVVLGYSISAAQTTGFKTYDLKYPLQGGSGTYEIRCNWTDVPGYYKTYTLFLDMAKNSKPLEYATIVRTLNDRHTVAGSTTKLVDNYVLKVQFKAPEKEEYSSVTLVADGKPFKLPFVTRNYIVLKRTYSEYVQSVITLFTITPEVLNALKNVKDLSLVYGDTTVKVKTKTALQVQSYVIDTEDMDYKKCDEKVSALEK